MLSLESHADVLRLHFVSWRSRVVGYSVSAYLVRGVLVDTGAPLLGAALERFAAARRLEGALVTHQHEDHAGNVGRLVRLGVPVGAAPATLDALRAPRPIGFYRRYTWGTMPPLGDAAVEPFEHEALRLVPTPGHSRDHHVVWDAERETLFGGDLFLGVKVRVAHPGENPRQLVESLRATAALRPKRLFDAHRGAVDDPTAKLLAKATWIEEAVGEIDRLLAAGWSDAAIRNRVLGREEVAGYFSRGDYSRSNFVRAVRRTRDVPLPIVPSIGMRAGMRNEE
jgi:glyoxylase-like metal-dependent hydrolase (beta-lactamase superfamily II)